MNIEAAGTATAETPSVVFTVKEVWLNDSATAGPDDSSWLKLPLPEPRTLELARLDNGAMSELASALKVPSGTYRQMRLLLVDRSEPLTPSAAAAGATFNDQVTSIDANGVESTLPLEIPDSARGIGIETELVVPVPRQRVLAVLAASNANASSTTLSGLNASGATGIGSTGIGSTGVGTSLSGATVPGTTIANMTTPSTTVPGTTITGTTGITVPSIPVPGTTTPGTTAPSSSSATASGATAAGVDNAVTVTSSVSFDAARDLVDFSFGGRPGFLLNPALAAHDVDKVGTIQARLDVSSVTPNAVTGRPDVVATAERLDETANRRVVVASAAVRTDGSFTLYPLPLEDGSDSTVYDIVIHGPGVTTVALRGVPVSAGAPGAGVSFGAITLLASATYGANLAAGSSVAPRGARVQFLQTLPGDAAPFVIEQQAVDPVTGALATNALLSAAPMVLFGTFGDSFSLAAATPVEGAGRYSVATAAPLYGPGDSAAPVAPPAAPGITAAFTVQPLSIAPPAVAGTIAATVTTAAPGKYDDGVLLVTHDGAVVTAAPLAPVLAAARSGGVVNVADVPSGIERGLYYVEAWAWSSANPEATFTRQPVTGAIDLRAAAAASAAISLN